MNLYLHTNQINKYYETSEFISVLCLFPSYYRVTDTCMTETVLFWFLEKSTLSVSVNKSYNLKLDFGPISAMK